MKNVIARVVFVGLAIPLLFFLAIYVPYMNHAALSFVVILFTLGSSIELKAMLEPEAGASRTINAIILGTLPPVTVYAFRLLYPGAGLALSWLAPLSAVNLGLFLLMAIPLALPFNPDSISKSAHRAMTNGLYLIYPGALSSAMIVILGAKNGSGIMILWFALIVFCNDILAWLFGITLGRTRGIFYVSPKKSLEGLFAGFTGSVGASFAGPLIMPGIIPESWWFLGLLGLAVGASVVVGDLFESGIKRATGVKDSGTIVPGRGGILDSFDSLLFAAPVFTLILVLFGLL